MGYLFAALAAVLWASAALAGALAPDVPPALLASARAVVGGGVLLLLAGPRAIFRLDLRAAWRTMLAASVSLALYQWGFFASVPLAGASAACIVSVALGPFVADALALASRRARPAATWLACAGAAAAGMLLLSFGNGVSAGGVGMAAVAGVAYALYAAAAAELESRSATKDAGLAVTALAFIGAGIILLPAARPHLAMLASAHGIASALYLGVCTTALAYPLFLKSLSHLSAAKALSVLMIQPVAAMVLSALLLREIPDKFMLAGVMLMFPATLLRNLVRPLRSSAVTGRVLHHGKELS